MNTIKSIFFDLGNVLVKYDLAIMLKGYIKHGCDPKRDISSYIMESNTGKKYMEGRIDSSRFYRESCRRLNIDISFDDFYRVWNSMFFPYPEMEDIIKKLKEKYPGVSLILISDTNEGHFNFIRKNYEFLDLMDHYVLSYEVGRMKPNRKIYREAIKTSGALAKDIFYTDDRLDLVEAARTLGLKAHQFTGHENLLSQLSKFGITV